MLTRKLNAEMTEPLVLRVLRETRENRLYKSIFFNGKDGFFVGA